MRPRTCTVDMQGMPPGRKIDSLVPTHSLHPGPQHLQCFTSRLQCAWLLSNFSSGRTPAPAAAMATAMMMTTAPARHQLWLCSRLDRVATAFHHSLQGTSSSKRKKQAKLQRALAAVKKQARREAATVHEGFAAVHLLHDPQAFAERLFGRLQGSRDKWEARTAMMALASR